MPECSGEHPERYGSSVRVLDRATSGLPRPWRTTIDWLATIVVAIAAVLAFEAEVAKPFRVPTSSMEPTLHCARPATGCEARFSDRVIACEICYRFSTPERGNIVVFHAPPAARACDGKGGVFVKRLIGLPGETWKETDGYVYIDGKKLNEPYIEPGRRDTSTYPATKISNGQYFMMGDNRAGSCDSRRWGTVPRKNLIGKVVATYWPPIRISLGS
jgi:signal peptidase I